MPENFLQLLCLKTRRNPWPRPGYPGPQQRIVRCTKYRVASFGPDNSRQGRPEHALATKTTIRGENNEVTRAPLISALMNNNDFEGKVKTLGPLQRIGETEDIRGVILVLCSNAGAYMTGQTIYVDGGWSIC